MVLRVEWIGGFGTVEVGGLETLTNLLILELCDIGKSIAIRIFTIDGGTGELDAVFPIPTEQDAAWRAGFVIQRLDVISAGIEGGIEKILRGIKEAESDLRIHAIVRLSPQVGRIPDGRT